MMAFLLPVWMDDTCVLDMWEQHKVTLECYFAWHVQYFFAVIPAFSWWSKTPESHRVPKVEKRVPVHVSWKRDHLKGTCHFQTSNHQFSGGYSLVFRDNYIVHFVFGLPNKKKSRNLLGKLLDGFVVTYFGWSDTACAHRYRRPCLPGYLVSWLKIDLCKSKIDLWKSVGILGNPWEIFGESKGIQGNPRESLGIFGNPWESLGILGNLWESLGILGNPWEIFGESKGIQGNPRESLGIFGNPWESLGIQGNLWESFGNPWESLGNLWESFGNLWESLGNLWESLGILGNLWESKGIFGNPLGILGNLWEIFGNPLGIFGNPWESLGNLWESLGILWYKLETHWDDRFFHCHEMVSIFWLKGS